MRLRNRLRALRRGLAALTCVATLLGIGRGHARAAPPGEDGRVFARASAALGALQVEEAARLLEPLAAKPGPYHEFALFRLSQSYAALGRDDDARRVSQSLESVKAAQRIVVDARQRPDDLPSQLRAAEQLLGDGKPVEAAALLEPAIVRHGPDPRLTRLLAQSYRQLGRDDLAEAWERR